MRARFLTLLVTAIGIVGCGSSVSTRAISSVAAYYVMPVRGIMPHELQNNFGVARDGGARAHEGLDIMAPEGREVLAIVSGKIDSKKWNNLGGNTILLAGEDGMIYYYAHLVRYREGIDERDRVAAGEVIGYVGKTGNASTPHLHFEVHQTKKSAAINPFSVLAVDNIFVLPMPIDSMKKQAIPATKRKK